MRHALCACWRCGDGFRPHTWLSVTARSLLLPTHTWAPCKLVGTS